MDDIELSAMLQRATADPADDFVERMLAIQDTRLRSVAERDAQVESYAPSPQKPRSPRALVLAGAAAILFVLSGVIFVATRGDQSTVVHAGDADLLMVEVDGEPVPASELKTASERVDARSTELGLDPDEVQIGAATSVLLNRFLAEVGRSRGAPVSDADITEALEDAQSIEHDGRVLTVDEAKADPEIRAEVAATLAMTRGTAVLTRQLGSPGEGPEAEARWRAWFSEQLKGHSVVVQVDGAEIGYSTLANSVLFLGTA